jgi:hypothetical protein
VAAHRKLDRTRVDLCAGVFRKPSLFNEHQLVSGIIRRKLHRARVYVFTYPYLNFLGTSDSAIDQGEVAVVLEELQSNQWQSRQIQKPSSAQSKCN